MRNKYCVLATSIGMSLTLLIWQYSASASPPVGTNSSNSSSSSGSGSATASNSSISGNKSSPSGAPVSPPPTSPAPGTGSAKRGPLILNPDATSTIWTVPQLCAAYNFPTKLTGGAIIGISEFGGGYTQTDLTLFSNTYMNGTPINITAISVDGGTNSPGIDPGADGEVTLDIEIAAAVYYYCTGKAPTIKVFFAPGISFLQENADIFQAAVTANCDVLSISWGLDENFETITDITALESAAAAAAAKGLAIFCAAGDGDATDQRGGESGRLNHVSLPSSCPHIVSVGGTTKTTTTEVVWNNGFALGTPYPLGTGGGYSTVFPIQSFQIGAPIAPTGNNGTGRMLPDVAANADPLTPYNIAFEGLIQAAGNGTSAATPLWAGLIASSGKKLGFVTPTLWLAKNRPAFVDITSGNNVLFTAATGPDPCSGLGVPNGAKVAALFQASVVTPPVYTNVVAIYNSSNKTLNLIGDAGSNSLTVSLQAGVLKVEGANSTTINSSTTSPFMTAHSGQLTMVVNLNDGNDAIGVIGIDSSISTINLGNGNDSAGFTLCSIDTMTIDGGAGVDTLIRASTTIGTLNETNIP